jgi:DNA polymerase elongation subunit (family B)
MFKAFREQDVDLLTRVGKYCIQDTLLPQKIFDKLSVLPNLIEMAKATWVPVEYLITRGQQVKVFSQSKSCPQNLVIASNNMGREPQPLRLRVLFFCL